MLYSNIALDWSYIVPYCQRYHHSLQKTPNPLIISDWPKKRHNSRIKSMTDGLVALIGMLNRPVSRCVCGTRVVMTLVISCICAHVPMSPRARTSVPDDWLITKASWKWQRSVVTWCPGKERIWSVVSFWFLLVHQTCNLLRLVIPVSCSWAACLWVSPYFRLRPFCDPVVVAVSVVELCANSVSLCAFARPSPENDSEVLVAAVKQKTTQHGSLDAEGV